MGWGLTPPAGIADSCTVVRFNHAENSSSPSSLLSFFFLLCSFYFNPPPPTTTLVTFDPSPPPFPPPFNPQLSISECCCCVVSFFLIGWVGEGQFGYVGWRVMAGWWFHPPPRPLSIAPVLPHRFLILQEASFDTSAVIDGHAGCSGGLKMLRDVQGCSGMLKGLISLS